MRPTHGIDKSEYTNQPPGQSVKPILPEHQDALKKSKKNEVTSGFILHQILSNVYSTKFPQVFNLIMLICSFSIVSLPILLRYYYGLNLFGETLAEHIIFAGCIIGFLIGLNIMTFGFVCAFDFERRFKTLKRLGKLIDFPGIPLKEFLFHMPKEEKKKKMNSLIKVQLLILTMTH